MKKNPGESHRNDPRRCRFIIAGILTVLCVSGGTVAAVLLDNGSFFVFLVLPVIVWAASFGTAGGVISAVFFSGLTFGVIVFVLGHANTLMYTGAAVLLQISIGYGVGRMTDLRRQVEREKKEKEVQVEEKRLLLAEIQHRIRNDIGLVRSLLFLEAQNCKDGSTASILLDAAERISVLIPVYEQLQGTDHALEVHVQPLIDDIVQRHCIGTDPDRTGFSVNVDDVRLPSKVAVSLGIILNELLTNTRKYAHPEPTVPLISITIRKCGTGYIELVFRDDGSGFPEPILSGDRLGFGLTIVQALATQHNGTFHLENDDGAVVAVRLRLDDTDSLE